MDCKGIHQEMHRFLTVFAMPFENNQLIYSKIIQFYIIHKQTIV
jgi:hypothetical protein